MYSLHSQQGTHTYNIRTHYTHNDCALCIQAHAKRGYAYIGTKYTHNTHSQDYTLELENKHVYGSLLTTYVLLGIVAMLLYSIFYAHQLLLHIIVH